MKRSTDMKKAKLYAEYLHRQKRTEFQRLWRLWRSKQQHKDKQKEYNTQKIKSDQI